MGTMQIVALAAVAYLLLGRGGSTKAGAKPQGPNDPKAAPPVQTKQGNSPGAGQPVSPGAVGQVLDTTKQVLRAGGDVFDFIRSSTTADGPADGGGDPNGGGDGGGDVQAEEEMPSGDDA